MPDEVISLVNKLGKEDINNIILRDRSGETLENFVDAHQTLDDMDQASQDDDHDDFISGKTTVSNDDDDLDKSIASGDRETAGNNNSIIDEIETS